MIIHAVSAASILAAAVCAQAGAPVAASASNAIAHAMRMRDVFVVMVVPPLHALKRLMPAPVMTGSERVGVGFAGTDAHRVFDRRDEDLAVADLAGLGGAVGGLHPLCAR